MSADPENGLGPPPLKPSGRARLAWWHPAFVLGTWFGAGLLPLAPGTWGSLAALPVVWLVHTYLGIAGLAIAAIVAFALAWWVAAIFISTTAASDPGEFVMDEVAGQMLTLALALAVMPANVVIYTAGFVLFRLMDIAKPWPANWADRSVGGGLGVVLDDVFAGCYAGAVMLIIYSLL